MSTTASANGTAAAKPTTRKKTGTDLVQVELTDGLRELVQKVSAHRTVPLIGVKAGEAMMQCFERAAQDVENMAADQVARAQELQATAAQFADMIRDVGRKYCADIEKNAVRMQQVGVLFHEAHKLLMGDAAPVIKQKDDQQGQQQQPRADVPTLRAV